MCSHHRIIPRALLILTVAYLAHTAHAQGTANGPTTSHNLFTQSGQPIWPIGLTNPVPIDLDPNGQPWTKHLNANLFGSGNPIPVTPGLYGLAETMINVGTETWHDWHMTFSIPSNNGGSVMVQGTQVLVNNIVIGTPVVGLGTDTIDLTAFSTPVNPGDQIQILVNFLYTGPTIPGGITAFTVEQYPTPEPASLALLSLGGLSFLRRRKEGF